MTDEIKELIEVQGTIDSTLDQVNLQLDDDSIGTAISQPLPPKSTNDQLPPRKPVAKIAT
jgi:hypothetical protein